MAADCVIIGGGVIGLATAWQLRRAGASVTLLEQRQLGGQASGAAAGIVEPLPGDSAMTALARLSLDRFVVWSSELAALTGIDIQLNQTGSLRLAFDADEATSLQALARHLPRDLAEPAAWLDPPALRQAEPALNRAALGALHLPGAYNVYSPHYVTALAAACRLAGVTIHEGRPAVGLKRQGDRLTAVATPGGDQPADQVLIAGGAWSGIVTGWLGYQLPILPDRGQIMALRPAGRPLRHVVHGGPGYAVPKADGLVVIGATHEEAGFDARVTLGGLTFLTGLARLLLPGLADASLAHVWAGLRPRLTTGPVPSLGRLPGWRNAWLATGHGAWGITLSPATGSLLAAAMLGQPTTLDLLAFAP